MKSLYSYAVLNNEVFYKCWHILEYITAHPNMSELDQEAIKATIMDALVYKGEINPNTEFLSLENLAITENPNDYHYEKKPNICGIPLFIKEQLRKRSLTITGGLPISLFLAKPPSKISRFCVYDPNTAISSIFSECSFYEAIYDSPTRNIRLTETRPFIEVPIFDELYLVDTITKRIFKSSSFKEKYHLEVKSTTKKQELTGESKTAYESAIKNENNLAQIIDFFEMVLQSTEAPDLAEMRYELEQSKKYFPEEWQKHEIYKSEMAAFFNNELFVLKNENLKL